MVEERRKYVTTKCKYFSKCFEKWKCVLWSHSSCGDVRWIQEAFSCIIHAIIHRQKDLEKYEWCYGACVRLKTWHIRVFWGLGRPRGGELYMQSEKRKNKVAGCWLGRYVTTNVSDWKVATSSIFILLTN